MNNKSLISQKIIKYLRRHYSYYIYENQQQDPEYEHKVEVWEDFYYFQYFNPYEVNDYQSEQTTYNDMMQDLAERVNDNFQDYMYQALQNDWISENLYEQWLNDIADYEDDIISYEQYMEYMQTYYLWLINYLLCWYIYDDGAALPQPPRGWQPQTPPPVEDFDPVVIITQDAEGNWHTIRPTD